LNFLKEKNLIDRVGAVFLLRRDGAALLQLRDDKPGLRHARQWVPPGGHAELGEGMEECAKREFLEETDYSCGDLHCLIEFEDLVPGWPVYTLTIFWVFYDGIQGIICNEGQELRFVSRNEANQYSIPDYLLKIWDLALIQANLKREFIIND